MAQWETIIQVRDVVNGALETARAEKKIGKSLEANHRPHRPAEDAFLAAMDTGALADLLIVSQVTVTVGEGIQAAVTTPPGTSASAAGRCCPR